MCTQRLGEQRSKASIQNLEAKHCFAAYQGATWRILPGSQVPDAKQCLKKIRKVWVGQMQAQRLNDSPVAWLMGERLLLSGRMEEEQKIMKPDELALYMPYIHIYAHTHVYIYVIYMHTHVYTYM